ncbi:MULTISPECIES: PHP-associated domain-containing protein [Clostridia]|uniref:PHP-associated domain-containing protein n=1 Tax=Clostridia TaxID=186801 RepID=UPI0023573322|nr:PHP domain-containing protein [Herbinix luporum]MDI9488223.1 PHP-associated domain-containing protein [Bacillota bacterium]
MGLYLYETHLHTKEASACSYMTGAEQVRLYKEAGYAGIIVTDHFFNGNTAICNDLPWEERVDLFCKGYENAKKEGDKIGLSVFFGWETNYKATEFLIYGLDKEWIKNHPEMLNWTIEEQYYQIHKAGGFVVHAHPFRIRPYIKEIRLFPDLVDAVEIYNVGNRNIDFDKKAAEYAKKHNLPTTAGTDAHGLEPERSGMGFSKPLNSIHDFIENIKARDYKLIMNM